MAADVPRFALALPGRWMQIPCDDDAWVAAFADLLRDAGRAAEADDILQGIDAVRHTGGDQILLKQEPRDPQVMAWVWPPHARATTTPELEPALAGGRSTDPSGIVTAFAHREGYACARVQEPSPSADASARTYGFGHPVSGRVLLISITVLAAESTDSAWAFYDKALRHVSWHDDDRDAVSGGDDEEEER